MIQSVYFLKLTNHYCNFVFKVNDIELYREEENGNISNVFPINECLNPDGNLATVEIFPMKNSLLLNDRTTVELEVEVAHADNLKQRENLLSTLSPNFAAYSSEGKLVPESYSLNLPLKYAIPFKDLNLYKLSTLTPDDKLMSDLTDAQTIMYNLFKQKKADEILNKFSYRTEDKAKARFQDLKKIEQSIYKDLSNTFSDRGNELLEFDPKEYRLRVEYGNRLFSIVDEFGDPPIVYYNEEIDMSVKYPMRFGRMKGDDQLVIVR